MWWFLFQSLIIFAVMASNIHWQWTPNNYLASTIGFTAALAATGLLNELILWTRKKRGARARQ